MNIKNVNLLETELGTVHNIAQEKLATSNADGEKNLIQKQNLKCSTCNS